MNKRKEQIFFRKDKKRKETQENKTSVKIVVTFGEERMKTGSMKGPRGLPRLKRYSFP